MSPPPLIEATCTSQTMSKSYCRQQHTGMAARSAGFNQLVRRTRTSTQRKLRSIARHDRLAAEVAALMIDLLPHQQKRHRLFNERSTRISAWCPAGGINELNTASIIERLRPIDSLSGASHFQLLHMEAITVISGWRGWARVHGWRGQRPPW
jgi:hypothetical protein